MGGALRIVVNPGAGSVRDDRPATALAEALPDAELVPLDADGGRSPLDVMREAADGAERLGVSGGDGTVSCAAEAALDHDLPLLVVPAGTLNHFARDLGIATLEDAVAAAQGDRIKPVDVGVVGDRVFVNNATIGLYPEVVDHRDRYRHRIGKWPALVVALVIVLRRGKPAILELDGRRRRVWLAFFGNCRYDEPGLIAATRSRLDDGVLDIRLVHADKKFARIRLVLAVLFRRLDHSAVYEAHVAPSVTVRSLDGPCRLAVDGETFDAPAAFEIAKRPRALKVLLPPPRSS